MSPATDITHVAHIRCPADLRDIKGWLVWKFEPSEKPGGKPRKVPYYAAGGRRLGVQGTEKDRAQLVTFDSARAAAARRHFDGVGLALMADWGVVALDFDNCITGGQIHPEVMALLGTTYAEMSPSGNGVRAFFRGQLGNKKSHGAPFGFETFSSKGFVTFTGQVLDVVEILGNEDTIAPVDDPVLALFNRRFAGEIERAHAPTVSAGPPLGLTPEQIETCLRVLDPSMGHDDWLHVGMALHHETQGEGFDLWNDWSGAGAQYPGRDALLDRWRSFGKGNGPAVTARSLVKSANERGAGLNLSVATPDEFEVVVQTAQEIDQALPVFARDGKGKTVLATVTNTVMAVRRPDLVGMRVAYDEFRDEITVARPGTEEWRPIEDADAVRIRMRLEALQFASAPKELVRDACVLVASEHRYDSAQLWLRSLKWDGKPRVERFLIDYLGAEDTPYTRAVALYIWSALAGRVIVPGVKADMVPIFEGDQGIRKSSSIEAMVPDPQFFVEIDLGQKDDETVRKLRGALVGEIAELSGLHKREVEDIKKFVVRKVEKWVPKYKEFTTTFHRRCLFIGTSNRTDILSDDTGNRRWLPVHVERADVAGIVAARDQLWAEGAALFNANGVMWAGAETLAVHEHRAFMTVDSWEDAIRDWLDATVAGEFEPDIPAGATRAATRFTPEQIMSGPLGLQKSAQDKPARNRVCAILRKFGFDNPNRRYDGVQERRWIRVRYDSDTVA